MKVSYKLASIDFVEVELTKGELGQIALRMADVTAPFLTHRIEFDEDNESILVVLRRESLPEERKQQSGKDGGR